MLKRSIDVEEGVRSWLWKRKFPGKPLLDATEGTVGWKDATGTILLLRMLQSRCAIEPNRRKEQRKIIIVDLLEAHAMGDTSKRTCSKHKRFISALINVVFCDPYSTFINCKNVKLRNKNEVLYTVVRYRRRADRIFLGTTRE